MPVRVQEFDNEFGSQDDGLSVPTPTLHRNPQLAQSQIVQANDHINNSIEIRRPTI